MIQNDPLPELGRERAITRRIALQRPKAKERSVGTHHTGVDVPSRPDLLIREKRLSAPDLARSRSYLVHERFRPQSAVQNVMHLRP